MSANLPTLRQLQFLIVLAEHGNFSRAAEAAHVTQPTLSAGIKELELSLGTTLVERGARGASLTPAGEAAAARARTILTEAEDLVHAARAACTRSSASVRMVRALAAAASPAGVRLAPRAPRSTSVVPRLSSSSLMPADKVGWVTCAASAARLKLPCSASTIRNCSCRKVGRFALMAIEITYR